MTHNPQRPSTKVTQSPSDARHHPNTFRGQPDIPHHAPAGAPGIAVCTGCQAIWDHKHWVLDLPRYKRLVLDKATPHVKCEGCERAERQEYDGEVELTSPLLPPNRQAVRRLIENTEAHIRRHNPIARIASLTEEGDTIRVLTISCFLAERIGKELEKAYGGKLDLQRLDREDFVRVRWSRPK